MENTPLNKSKFYALYWGQKVMYVEGAGLVATGSGGWNLSHPDFFLELKPVSSISDEDAKELVKLRFIHDGGDVNDIVDIKVSVLKKVRRPNAVYIESVITHKRWPSFVENVFIGEVTRVSYALIDYLRSRGYATPWMGLSVKELVNIGWVKLKS